MAIGSIARPVNDPNMPGLGIVNTSIGGGSLFNPYQLSKPVTTPEDDAISTFMRTNGINDIIQGREAYYNQQQQQQAPGQGFYGSSTPMSMDVVFNNTNLTPDQFYQQQIDQMRNKQQEPPPQNNLAGVLSQYQPPAPPPPSLMQEIQQPPAPAPVQQPMAAPVLAAQPRPQPAAQQKLSPSKTGLQSFASVVSPGVAPVAQPRPAPRPAPVAQTKPSLRQLPVAKSQPAMRPAPVQQLRPAAQTTRPGLQVFPSMVSPGPMARSVSRVNPPLLPTRPMGRR